VVKLLVTGAGGLVGKLVVETASAHHDVRGLSHSELDVTDREAVFASVREFSPHVVLNCAAYTDVDGAERYPDRALRVNADATQWVAEAALEQRADLVHISTDYVFDGNATTPYREDDETGPRSSYGRSKLEGEHRAVVALAQRRESLAIVRTGWLYGKGKGFVDWARRRLEAGEKLPVVEDQRGSPTYAGELAEALVRIATGGHRGVFHFVNQGEATWLDLGRALAEELGHDVDRLEPIQAQALARPAPRPGYSVLSVENYERVTGARVRPWRDALKTYLAMS
jgi:dTDP-4-dehydrorhamnose reductase